MNQEKIGAFIAKRRKELNLTQKEPAITWIRDRVDTYGSSQSYCISHWDVVTLFSDNRIMNHTKEVLPGGERRPGFLRDMPGKRPPCLHERTFARQRSARGIAPS